MKFYKHTLLGCGENCIWDDWSSPLFVKRQSIDSYTRFFSYLYLQIQGNIFNAECESTNIQGVPENMRRADIFTLYLRPYKTVGISYKGLKQISRSIKLIIYILVLNERPFILSKMSVKTPCKSSSKSHVFWDSL